MKKLSYIIVLVLILGLALTGCTLLSNVGQVPTTGQSGISYLTKGGTTEAEAEEVVLYAGQYENVGVVKVWNDTENLYVKYIVDDPWCLTETHLHVAAVPEDIPQTKKGNPIPGQFDYEGEHDCETYFLYTIPLADLNVELFIAAHAVVVDTGTIETEVDLKWGRSFEDGSSICSSLNLGDAVTCGLALPVNVSQTVWDKNTWAYWTQYPVDNVSTYRFQVRHFQALFDLPKEIKPDNVEDLILFSPYDHFDKNNLPVNDIILINDNLYVYLNNIEIGRKGTCYPPASLDWYVSPDVGWYVPGSFSADGPQNLIVGPNIIDIVAEESCGWGGMGQLGLKLIWHPEESAWAGEEPLPGDNWATYFTYVLQMPLWNSTGEAGVGYTCAGGALKTDDGPYGFVILNTDASGMLIVEFALKDATANADFKLYVNQVDVDGPCKINFPNIVGELTTNDQGNGNAHFYLPRWVDADKFWVSAMELPMPYYPIHGLMLRSEAVVLD